MIIAGNKTDVGSATEGTINYKFYLASSSPEQVFSPVLANCPADDYKNGELSLPSVTVSDGLGGIEI